MDNLPNTITPAKISIPNLINFVQQEARRARHFGELEHVGEWLQAIESTAATAEKRRADAVEATERDTKEIADKIVADARLVAAKVKADSEAERGAVKAETIALVERRDLLTATVAKLQTESEALQLKAHRLRQAMES